MPVMRVRERPRHRPASVKMLTPVEVDGPNIGRIGAGLYPPVEWLTDEMADQAPPRLTLYNGGRIAGVVAPAGVCTINELTPGECWVVPRPADGRGSSLFVPLDGGWDEDYRMAHVGSMVTAEGVEIACAVLAGAGGHAAPQASNLGAAMHYNATNPMDDTRWQVARGRYVWSDRAGGVVFVGATWPEVTERQVAEMRAAACSIDYRWVTGRGVDDYRLLGATLVNIGALPTKYEHQIRAAGVATITPGDLADVLRSARHPALVAAVFDQGVPMSRFARQQQTPCVNCGQQPAPATRTAAYVVEDDTGADYGDEIVWGTGLYGMFVDETTMADGSAAYLVRPIVDQLAQDDVVVVPAAQATMTGRSYEWECDDDLDSDDAVLSPPPPEAGGSAPSTAPAAGAGTPPPVAAAVREKVRLAAAPPPPGVTSTKTAPATPATAPAATDTAALEGRVTALEQSVTSMQTMLDDIHQQMLSTAKNTASQPVAV